MNGQEWDVSGFQARLHENGLLEVVVDGELSPQLIQRLLQHVWQTVQDVGPLTGLLLDLRRSAAVSIVRVSGLADTLSQMVTPMAVVFIRTQQHRLASLIRPTLSRREEIAFFTNPLDAWHYLLCRVDTS